MGKGALSPKRIARETKIALSHVSRALRELEELGVVECLTSEEIRKGKIYTVAAPGRPYVVEVEKNIED